MSEPHDDLRAVKGIVAGVMLAVPLWLLLLLVGCAQVERTGPHQVLVWGPITPTVAADAARIIHPGDTVTLRSDGGYVLAAAQIARVLESAHADTTIEGNCASACALAFAAGSTRTIPEGARLGVHQSEGGGAAADILMVSYLLSRGAPDDLAAALLRTPRSAVAWFDASRLRGWAKR